jgi:homoserine kinase
MNADVRATEVRAFSPASVGNAAVGFDVLGHALDAIGDTVIVRRIPEREVRIAAIRGADRELPGDAAKNTAGRALIALRAAQELDHGFEIEIEKGIPYGSGLGGSAASATAAVVAANALLQQPLPRAALYPFALAGEAVASGALHGDNVAPQLLGGLVFCGTGDGPLIRLPVPEGLHAAVVRPELALETAKAREPLREPYALGDFVAQSSLLGRFLCGCFLRDLDLIRLGLRDVLVEPRRAALIPGFATVKAAALDLGALGCSISGAGPSMFAWFADREAATRGADAMAAAFAHAGLGSQRYVSLVDAPGARVLE